MAFRLDLGETLGRKAIDWCVVRGNVTEVGMSSDSVDMGKSGSRVAVIADTAAGVPEAHGVYVVPMGVSVSDGEPIPSNEDGAMATVLAALADGSPLAAVPPSVEGIVDAINRAISDGFSEFVMVTTSSGLSQSYDMACVVSATLAEESTDIMLEVIDSLEVASSARMAVMSARELLDEGVPLSELGIRMDAMAARMRMWMAVDDLSRLVSAGVLGRLSALWGTAFGAMPILSCDESGRCTIVKRTKGGLDAADALALLVSEFASAFSVVSVSMCHAPDAANLDAFEEAIRKGCADCDVEVASLDRQPLAPEIVAYAGAEAMGVAVRGIRI